MPERATRPESNDSAWRDRILKQAWDEQVQEETAEANAELEAHIPPNTDAQVFELRRLFRL